MDILRKTVLLLLLVSHCVSPSRANAASYKKMSVEELSQTCNALLDGPKKMRFTKCVKTLLEKYPDDGYGYFLMGKHLIEKGKYDKGIDEMKLALSKQLSNEQSKCVVISELAMSYAKYGDITLAEDYCKKTVDECKRFKGLSEYATMCSDAIRNKKAEIVAIAKREKEIEAEEAQTRHRNNLLVSFKENYSTLEIGMRKKNVLEIIGLNPTDKKAVSLKRGVFECWSWHHNYSPYYINKAVTFMNGSVVELGQFNCDGYWQ